MGASFRITTMRGKRLRGPWADYIMATYHPSAILRAPEKATRMRMRDDFVDDLRRAFVHIFGSREQAVAHAHA